MTQAAVAAEVHQTLDVHRGFATKIAFDLIVAVDGFADLQDFSVRQLMNAALSRNADLLDDFLCELRTNPVNIL